MDCNHGFFNSDCEACVARAEAKQAAERPKFRSAFSNPVLTGQWPRGTWFQKRLIEIRAAKIDAEIREFNKWRESL